MNLPKQLLDYIDNKSSDLISLLCTKIEENKDRGPIQSVGSISEKITLDLSGKIDVAKDQLYSTTDYRGHKIDSWLATKDRHIGYDESAYKEFSKFISSLYVKFEINSITSKDFIESIVFDWLVHNEEYSSVNLSSHIVERISAAATTKKYSFPILYLEIPGIIKIGDVEIGYLTKKDFDEIEEIAVKNGNEKPTALREKYQGAVVARTIQFGESEKAKELAFERCSLVIDVLKLHSKTMYIPDSWSDFNLDLKARSVNMRTIFSQASDNFKDFSISMHAAARITQIGFDDIKKMRELRMDAFGAFISEKGPRNEISQMIINSIQNFADAISNRDLHKRISELFSVYESLLVPNKQAHILESLKKYGSKLVHNTPTERTTFKQLLTKLYDVRSNLVHHGERKDFTHEELVRLQIGLISLIFNLIQLSKKHNTKELVLKEIDDAINAA